MVHLLELPDEIILKILEYLNGVDKLEVLKVCKNLNRIGLDRKILKYFNFSKNYKLNLNHLRFLARKSTCSLVTVLNLNDVYWIASHQLRNNLMKFKNLTALYVCGTQLTSVDLTTVLTHTVQVRKLAVSLNPEAFCPDINLPITHLFIRYNRSAIQDLMLLLRKFVVLEELWIVEINLPVKGTRQMESAWCMSTTQVTKISKRIVMGRQHSQIPDRGTLMQKLEDSNTNWINTFNYNSDTQFYVYEEWTNMPAKTAGHDEDFGMTIVNKGIIDNNIINIINNITMKNIFSVSDQSKMILNNLMPSKLNYTSLNLVRSIDASPLEELIFDRRIFEDFFFLPNLKHLRKLRTESLPFWEDKPDEPATAVTFKKRRNNFRNIEFDNSLFERFTLSSPDIEDFELIDMSTYPVRQGIWTIDILKYIRNWTMLKQLTLSSVNFTNGKFLIDVTKNCTMLEVLKINDKLLRDISSDVCEALRHAANLKDFRYECRGSMPLDRILETVVQCKRLERLYLQSHSVSKISIKPLTTLVTQSTNLVFFFLYVKELSDVCCKRITMTFKDFALMPNLIFCIRGQSFNLDNVAFDDIPHSHIHDLVTHSADMYFDCLKDF